MNKTDSMFLQTCDYEKNFVNNYLGNNLLMGNNEEVCSASVGQVRSVSESPRWNENCLADADTGNEMGTFSKDEAEEKESNGEDERSEESAVWSGAMSMDYHSEDLEVKKSTEVTRNALARRRAREDPDYRQRERERDRARRREKRKDEAYRLRERERERIRRRKLRESRTLLGECLSFASHFLSNHQ